MTRTVSTLMLFLLVMSMLTFTLSIQPARAGGVDDWLMFHHDPSHTGASTSTGPTTNNTQWTYTTGFYVLSSPAVVGGLVYVGSEDDNVYCLNATNGMLVWNYTTGGQVQWSSPAVAGGLVYVGSDDANVYCLNATNGTLVWNYYMAGEPVFSSPAVAGGFVYVGSGGKVYCLNATNGALVWNYQTGGPVASSPAVVGGLVYVASYDANVYCLNAATGTLVWNYRTGGWVHSSPAVVGGLVYVGSEDDNVYCLNAATGNLVWNYTTGGWVDSSPAVADGFVYVGSYDKNVYCLNAITGTFVWNYTTDGQVYSSPAVVGGMVYVGSSSNNVYCLNASNGTLVWIYYYTTGGSVDSSPAVVNGVVYVGSAYGIYAFGSSSSPQTYSVSFSESGLVQGTQWSVTFNGMTSGNSSDTVTFYGVEDGTYSFTVGNVSGYVAPPADESVTVASPSSGTITVNGANTNQTITFQYTVTSWDPVKNSYSIINFGSIWARGDCYGLSSTALLYFTHYTLGDNTYPYFPSQYPQATSTLDLDISGASNIMGQQTTLNNATLAVMFHQVFGAPADNNLIPPSPSATFPNEAEQYSYLIGNLTIGQPVVLILGTATGWPHAIVAWGAGTIGNGNLSGNIAIYLCDNNYPKTTKEAIIDPTTDSFSYDVYNWFYVMDPVAVTQSLVDPHLYVGQPWWGTIWLGYMVTGYNIVVESRMVTIYSNGLKDYFTAPGDSQTFICGIPGTFGIEEGNMQVYAIPEYTPFSVSDPTSGRSTTLITRVDNESGQLVGYGYLLDATAVQGDLNYTVTPTASGLSINAGNNPLNANVTFFTATEQNSSVFQASNIQVGALQTTNFTVSNWQTLNQTGITTIPEFPDGASAIALTLSSVFFAALATAVRRRKIRHPQRARSS